MAKIFGGCVKNMLTLAKPIDLAFRHRGENYTDTKRAKNLFQGHCTHNPGKIRQDSLLVLMLSIRFER